VIGEIPLKFLREEEEQSIFTWIITCCIISGWGVGMTWGIGPYIRE